MVRVRTLATLMALASCVALGAAGEESPELAYHAGYRLVQVPRAGQEPLRAALWYPTETEPSRVSYPLPVRPMEGQAALNAGPAAGPFPLVIYSHGAGGCGIMGATYAEALTEAGSVVAAPDHGDEFQVGRSDGGLTANAQRARQWVQWASTRSRARFKGRASFKFAHRPAVVRRNDPVAATVNHYAVAFFRRYLKDDRSVETVLTAPTEETFVLRADPGGRAAQ